jgi:hypothetical protein
LRAFFDIVCHFDLFQTKKFNKQQKKFSLLQKNTYLCRIKDVSSKQKTFLNTRTHGMAFMPHPKKRTLTPHGGFVPCLKNAA